MDSLKDAAVKLVDDEVGGNVNRAIQHCNAQGVDVAVLHHQRKGERGEKPTTLADVYGSIVDHRRGRVGDLCCGARPAPSSSS
jgi:hypothetical protein